MGKEVLAAPITRIINSSITSGVFPEVWKNAVVTPILKKDLQRIKLISVQGTTKTNYRPVSCLAAASKVLEKVVCNHEG